MLVIAIIAAAAAFALIAILGATAPRVLKVRDGWVTVVVAVAFGTAALWANGDPTRIAALDALFRVVVVVGATILARYARRGPVAAGVAVAVVAGIGSPLEWLAAIAAGMAIA